MAVTEIVVALVVGLAAGAVLRYVLGARPAAPPDTRVEDEIRRALAAREADLAAVRAEAREATTALATARAQVVAAEHLLATQQRLHADSERELRDTFKALSADALKESAPEFLRLATEHLARFQEAARGDLALREERIQALVRPLEEQLETYQRRLQQAEAGQAGALGEVRKHLETLAAQSQTLSSETQRLRLVLSSNQARGRWGEETLRRVVEAAGLSAHCDFTEQVRQGEGQPDLIVKLPGDRIIIVDSKVPDLDVLGALGTADEVKRAEALAAHAAKLRDTIRALAERDYPRQFANALDHVVLFLPAESLFSAALEGDRELIVWAAERRIMLATPASLIALLRSVSMSWQQYEQSANAREIAEEAQELYRRIVTFIGHFDGIRDGLSRANAAFDRAVGSYEGRVRPSGERLLKLGGGSAKGEMADVRPIESSLRLPPAPPA